MNNEHQQEPLGQLEEFDRNKATPVFASFGIGADKVAAQEEQERDENEGEEEATQEGNDAGAEEQNEMADDD